MNREGRQLWEPTDTATAFTNLRNFTARWFGDSPTILGWYIMDDQTMTMNRDNVFSARRVDSLLTTWSPHKKGFTVPAAYPDYLSIASYSNVSYQSYPLELWTRTDSENPYSTSVQKAWDNHTAALTLMSAVAESKGVPNYATLQSFAGENRWRTPTPQENLCQVNLALAYGVNGILYWRYGGSGVWDDAGGHTPFWHSVKNTVGPYIEKMGPIFASLQWQHAWKWGFDSKPTESRIIDITCNEYTNDPAYEDWLYLQVAEFAGMSDDKYFFLVNRRCLPEDSITGTVKFSGWGGHGKSDLPYCITDMLTDSSWLCDNGGPGDPYPRWDYSIPPGAGRLYRVKPGECDTVSCTSCGDANSDDAVDIGDASFLIQYIFAGGPAPGDCGYALGKGDANGDCAVDVSDASYLIQYIFAGGPAPHCGTGCQ